MDDLFEDDDLDEAADGLNSGPEFGAILARNRRYSGLGVFFC
jgi:hypothetical protein